LFQRECEEPRLRSFDGILREVVDGKVDVARCDGGVPRQSVGGVSDQYRLVLCRRAVLLEVVSVEAVQRQRRVRRQVLDQQTRVLHRGVDEQL